MGEFYTPDQLRAAYEKERNAIREKFSPPRRIKLGERFSLIHDKRDYISEISEQYETITWINTALMLEGFNDRSLTGDISIDQEVVSVRPSIITLDGTKTTRIFQLGLTLNDVSRREARQLGCRLFYKDNDGLEHSMELFGDIDTEHQAVYFQRQKGISYSMSQWQLTINNKIGEDLTNTMIRLNPEAEFYLREPRPRKLEALS